MPLIATPAQVLRAVQFGFGGSFKHRFSTNDVEAIADVKSRLIEAGLVRGDGPGTPGVRVYGLTDKGHRALDAATNGQTGRV